MQILAGNGNAKSGSAQPLQATAPKPRFYLMMAVVFAVVAVLGFAPTYWLPLARGTLKVPPITHLHALFF